MGVLGDMLETAATAESYIFSSENIYSFLPREKAPPTVFIPFGNLEN